MFWGVTRTRTVARLWVRADGLARGVRIERSVVLSMMRAPVDQGADTGPFGSSDDLRRPPMFTVDLIGFTPLYSTITSYTPAHRVSMAHALGDDVDCGGSGAGVPYSFWGAVNPLFDDHLITPASTHRSHTE